MAIRASKVSVGVTPTRLSSVNINRTRGELADLNITFKAPSDIYIGGVDVDTSSGYLVSANIEYSLDLENGEILYAIVASGTVSVSVLEVGL